MEQFEKLLRTAHAVGVMAALMMILFWVGAAVGAFVTYTFPITTAIGLFIGGCIVGLAGEAASSTMAAMAYNMKDDHLTRKCMEKLVARLEKKEQS